MAFFKKRTNLIFLFIIFMLLAALAAVSYFAYDKYNAYVEIKESLNESIEENNIELEKAQKIIDDYTTKIAEYDDKSAEDEKAKAELNEKLQAALEAKERLEKENNSLKTQLQQLTDKKRTPLQKQIALKNSNEADTSTGAICYLTFDDGPTNNTLKILDILDAYGIKGTFFVVGTGTTAYMPRITSRGHAIGLHSTSHVYSEIYKDANSYIADINQMSEIVFNATGVRSNIIRFPGGSSNSVSQKYCKGIMTDLTVKVTDLGYSYYDWNINSGDANAPLVSAEKIVNNVLTKAKGQKDICVLLHDGWGKTTTVEALPQIIEGLDAMGYRFAALDSTVSGFHQSLRN